MSHLTHVYGSSDKMRAVNVNDQLAGSVTYAKEIVSIYRTLKPDRITRSRLMKVSV